MSQAETKTPSKTQARRRRVRAAGGWYSRRWGKAPAGWGFPDEQSAQDFAAVGGDIPVCPATVEDVRDDRTEAQQAQDDERAQQVELWATQDAARADYLFSLADALQCGRWAK